MARAKDTGEAITEGWARWQETESVKWLLRGPERPKVDFVVVENDPTLPVDLEAARAVVDRWERRRALCRLAGRVARQTVSVYERPGLDPSRHADPFPSGTTGEEVWFWLLRPGHYTAKSGIDLGDPGVGDGESGGQDWGVVRTERGRFANRLSDVRGGAMPGGPAIAAGRSRASSPIRRCFTSTRERNCCTATPASEYRWDGQGALLVGLEEGARLLAQTDWVGRELRIGGSSVRVLDAVCEFRRHEIQVTPHLLRYRLAAPWLPFSQENYRHYQGLDDTSRADERDRLARAGLLISLRGHGVEVRDRLYVAVEARNPGDVPVQGSRTAGVSWVGSDQRRVLDRASRSADRSATGTGGCYRKRGWDREGRVMSEGQERTPLESGGGRALARPLTVTHVLEHLFCPRFTYFEYRAGDTGAQERRPLVQMGRQSLTRSASGSTRATCGKSWGWWAVSSTSRWSAGELGVRGAVDEVLTLADGSRALFDYKFAEYKGQIYANVRTQSVLYGMLIEEASGAGTARLLVLRAVEPPVVEVGHEEKDRQAARAVLTEVLEVIQTGLFPEATEWKARCRDCCYRNICIQ